MSRNRFTNPDTNYTYDWLINFSEEDEFGKSRNIEHGASTSDLGFVRQQSDDGPLIIRVRGTILTLAQFTEFKEWFALCRTQTINFRDFADDEYEVIITKFMPTRQRTIHNPRDFANIPYHYWKYELEMEVIRVISGTWEGVAN